MSSNIDIHRAAMRLLRAIYEKTGGRSRAVRDVTELDTGLSAEAARAAWQHLLGLSLIERFSTDYAARLSPGGVEFVESGQLPPVQGPLQRVLMVHGHGTPAHDIVSQFLMENSCELCLVHAQAVPGRTIMQQIDGYGEVAFAVVLLTPEDLGAAPGAQDLRPRMNVLMELGYLMGSMGPAKVCALAIDVTGELPADLAGVELRSLDSSEASSEAPSEDWKAALTSRISGTDPRS